ncbi:JmjC domain-containing histone demethylation protein 1 [Microbotryomycetes sp. JL221]|nr:JmjC domain-containing histone demethylation protein 1 [Microbotryomycetes sp. JL221]
MVTRSSPRSTSVSSTPTTTTKRKRAVNGDDEDHDNSPRSKAPKGTTVDDGVDDLDGCPVCTAPDRAPSARKPRKGSPRIECDNHWQCVATRSDSAPELIDKWYCSTCINDSANSEGNIRLKTIYKQATRKSSRTSTTNKINYANLDNHLPADVGKWFKVAETRPMVQGTFKHYIGHDITNEWVWNNPSSFKEPFIIDEPQGLGLKMPPRDISIQQISKLVGPDTPLEVIDVASQSSLSHWTLQQWADYYDDPSRDKIRNVISLEISETPFGDMVDAPTFVKNMDWVETVWPPHLKSSGQYPKVQKYCLMSVKRCWTDWHVDFAGSSVYYHILRGGKTFYFIRPTPENLTAYEKWSGSQEKQENTWLGDDVDCVYKVTLQPGNTMIIPTGWPHAVYTPSDSLVIGGNFLHSLNIETQLRIYAIELATKVPRKFRFPHFVKMLWFVCHTYAHRIAYALSTKTKQLPIDINERVLNGLKELSEFLIEQTSRINVKNPTVSNERRRIAKENIPWEWVQDPIALSRQLRMLVLQATGEPIDELCMPPPDYHENYSYANGSNGVSGVGQQANSKSASTSQMGGQSSPVTGKPTKRQLDKINNAQEVTSSSTMTPQIHSQQFGQGRTIAPAPTSTSSNLAPPSSATTGIKTSATPPAPSSTTTTAAAKRPRKDPGEIISKTFAPTSVIEREEIRIDPTNPNAGPKQVKIKHSQNATTTVRKFVELNGDVVIESKMIVTTTERVRYPAMTQQQQQQQHHHDAAAIETAGVAGLGSQEDGGRLYHDSTSHQGSIEPYNNNNGMSSMANGSSYATNNIVHESTTMNDTTTKNHYTSRLHRPTTFKSDRFQEYVVRDVPPSVKGYAPITPMMIPPQHHQHYHQEVSQQQPQQQMYHQAGSIKLPNNVSEVVPNPPTIVTSPVKQDQVDTQNSLASQNNEEKS